jgi:hypothetical protein
VWSGDVEQAQTLAARLEVGGVGGQITLLEFGFTYLPAGGRWAGPSCRHLTSTPHLIPSHLTSPHLPSPQPLTSPHLTSPQPLTSSHLMGEPQVGTAWVNQHVAVHPTMPFGGR